MLSSSLPAWPTKGSPSRSSSAPGRLADQHPLRRFVADAEHRLRAAGSQPAGGARGHGRLEVGQSIRCDLLVPSIPPVSRRCSRKPADAFDVSQPPDRRQSHLRQNLATRRLTARSSAPAHPRARRAPGNSRGARAILLKPNRSYSALRRKVARPHLEEHVLRAALARQRASPRAAARSRGRGAGAPAAIDRLSRCASPAAASRTK